MVQKRVYITPDQLPNWGREFYTDACMTTSIPDNRDSLEYFLGPGTMQPIDYSTMGPGVRFDIAPDVCVDCTLTGTNKKPYFWP